MCAGALPVDGDGNLPLVQRRPQSGPPCSDVGGGPLYPRAKPPRSALPALDEYRVVVALEGEQSWCSLVHLSVE